MKGEGMTDEVGRMDGMGDLAEFLLARIAEDEVWQRRENCDCAMEGFPLIHGAVCPVKILAECDAKRRIVEFMVNEVKDARRRPGWTIPDSEVDEKGRDYRVGYENARAQLLPEALDRTERLLRLLALPYADHPSYRDEWRP